MEEELEESWKILETTEVNCCEIKEEIKQADEILYRLKMECKYMNASEKLEELKKLQKINILGVSNKTTKDIRTKDNLIKAIEIIENNCKKEIEGLQQ